ncbi:MAG: hypothetical protein ACE5R7_09130, partial [Nitrosarchaeum sp.]
SKSQNRLILVIGVSFLVVCSGFFLYYFMNQTEIDSRIIQNTIITDPETRMATQYGVGQIGSDHAHAAILVFVDGKQINFGLEQYQLSSKYIHFEDGNPYLIHKHATGVPLDMLFASFGMNVSQKCIMLNEKVVGINMGKFCVEQNQSLVFYVNGEKYDSDISKYEIKHNDRILVFFGNDVTVPKYLAYLDSLEIYDIPKKIPRYSGNEFNV